MHNKGLRKAGDDCLHIIRKQINEQAFVDMVMNLQVP